MKAFLHVSRAIDRVSRFLGRVVGGMAVLMVLTGAFNAVTRYLGRFVGRDLSSNTYTELQWYLFSLIFLLGAAYTLQRDEHVRVDVLYGRLSRRAQAWIDLAGTLAFLLPFCALVIWTALPYWWNSFDVREDSPDPGGLLRWPIKGVIVLSFALLFAQGISEAIKRVAILRGAGGAEEEAA